MSGVFHSLHLIVIPHSKLQPVKRYMNSIIEVLITIIQNSDLLIKHHIFVFLHLINDPIAIYTCIPGVSKKVSVFYLK